MALRAHDVKDFFVGNPTARSFPQKTLLSPMRVALWKRQNKQQSAAYPPHPIGE